MRSWTPRLLPASLHDCLDHPDRPGIGWNCRRNRPRQTLARRFHKRLSFLAGASCEGEVKDHERRRRVRFLNPLQDVGSIVNSILEIQPRLVMVVASFSKAVQESEMQVPSKGSDMAKSLCELDRLWRVTALDCPASLTI